MSEPAKWCEWCAWFNNTYDLYEEVLINFCIKKRKEFGKAEECACFEREPGADDDKE